MDYTDSYALTGELTTTLTSVNPYAGWQAPGGMNLWATAGHGWGEFDDGMAAPQASDLTQQMVAGGVNGPLMESGQVIEGGTTSLRLKAETAFTRADIDGAGVLRSTTLNASRHRLMVEGSHVRKLVSGATFTPSLELGMRNDGGDGETGTGLEVGGGLRYTDPAMGLTIEGRARTLLSHTCTRMTSWSCSTSTVSGGAPARGEMCARSSTSTGNPAHFRPSWTLSGRLLLDYRELLGGGFAVATGSHLEPHFLPLAQRPESGPFDSGDVDESVLRAVLRLDEPVALGGVEPLDRSSRHRRVLQSG